MSTKIYRAWRLPAENLNAFFDQARPQMYGRVLDRVESIAMKVSDESVTTYLEKQRQDYVTRGWTKLAERDYSLTGWKAAWFRTEKALEYIQRARDHVHGYLMIDCGFNVWLHEGSAYVIPWGSWGYHDELVLQPYVRDYSYWNNTDKPDDIPDDEWSERGDTWGKINLYGDDAYNRHRLEYSVVDLDRGGGSISSAGVLIDVARRLHEKLSISKEEPAS